MELSPFKSITGSDTFWDGSIPNPLSVGIPTSISQTTPETSVAGLRNHLTSDLVPNRSVTRVGIDSFSEFLFLGEYYRTDLGLIFPPEEKFVSLCQRILLFQHSQFVTARQFSQLLGFLNSLAEVIPRGRLHIRPLQFYLQHWLPASQDWEANIPLLLSLLPHLQWWINRENVMKSLSLSVPVPTLTLYTDTSNLS